MYLLIDIGNTSGKMMMYDPSAGVLPQVHDLSELDSILQHKIHNICACAISSVSNQQQVEELVAQLTALGIVVEVAAPREIFGDVKHGYSQVNQHGVDRWLALIGARSISKSNLAVVDLGTANTLDVISVDGQHLGGWIAPGAELQNKSLQSGTANLMSSKQLKADIALATNTADSISHGCIAQSLGFMLSVEVLMEQKFGKDEFKIIATGGGLLLIPEEFRQSITCVPELVFLGLGLYLTQVLSEKAPA